MMSAKIDVVNGISYSPNIMEVPADFVEEWKDIPEIPGFRVSNTGRVIDNYGTERKTTGGKTNRAIRIGADFQHPDGERYRREFELNYIVANLFLPKREDVPPGVSVIPFHIDGNRRNSHVCNLRWMTKGELTKEAWKTVTRKPSNSKDILHFNEDGDLIGKYETMTAAAKALSLGQNAVYNSIKSGVKKYMKNKKRELIYTDFRVDNGDLPGEEWKPIETFEDLADYDISNMGRIRHSKDNVPRNGKVDSGTNPLFRDKKICNLVANHFVKEGAEIENKTVVHIDGNPKNNVATNLKWMPINIV